MVGARHIGCGEQHRDRIGAHCRLALAHFLRKESKSVVERHNTRKELQAGLSEYGFDEFCARPDGFIAKCTEPIKSFAEPISK
jgi:hypothetical protein